MYTQPIRGVLAIRPKPYQHLCYAGVTSSDAQQ